VNFSPNPVERWPAPDSAQQSMMLILGSVRRASAKFFSAPPTRPSAGENPPPPIASCKEEDYETYARYLYEMPFLNYAICHLKGHILESSGAMNAPSLPRWDHVHLLLQLIQELTTDNSASHLFEPWLSVKDVQWPSYSSSQFRNMLLWQASKVGLSQVVDTVLSLGAELNATVEGKAALHIAAEQGHKVTVKLLLDRGAYIHATTHSSNFTALHIAARNRRTAVVQVLLDRGARI